MGSFLPLDIDKDIALILAVMALIYRENGDKTLLMGLLILLISISTGR